MGKRTLGILFLVLFIVMLGFSVLFPVEPYYVRTFGATSKTMGWLLATYSLGQFVFSPIWGRISDKVGRKPMMVVGLSGYAVSMALFGLAPSVPWLFVARGLAGVLSSATLPAAMAVVADTTTGDERAKGMGVLGAAFGLGAIFGPFFGGMLGSVNIQLPFFVAAGLSLLTLLFVLAWLPETLGQGEAPSAGGAQSRWAAVNRRTVWLYLVALLVTFSLAGLETAFPFLAADRLGLNERTVGYVYAVMGLAAVIVQGGLVGPLKKRLGEERMILAGLLFSGLGLALIAVSRTPLMATGAISLFAAGHGLIRPANASLISQRAGTGYGLAIGVLDSMDSLGRVLGPIAGGTLYLLRDSLPFWSGAVINWIALGLLAVFLAASQSRTAGTDLNPSGQ